MTNKIPRFEQGPIRPPNEAKSLLLRVTRNCPWNHCLFCPVYKQKKFSLRTVQDIRQDIDTAREIANEIREISWRLGDRGKVTDRVYSQVVSAHPQSRHYQSIAVWMYYETGACFLQDADNLIMKTDDLVKTLRYLRKTFPEITRVTTYARSGTIKKKSVDSLTRIRKAGLDRVHIGLESGHDPLLKIMKKGVSGNGHIEAGRRIKAAGMSLSEYVMPGLGGRKMWRAHAVDTARVLNEIDPDFIRIRSLRVPNRIPLYEKLLDGSFTLQSDDQAAKEIGLFLETLDGITGTITSDHIMNLLPEVTGKLPEDKEKMLDVVKGYLDLPDLDRLVYRMGRRGGAFESTSDLTYDPATYNKIRDLIESVRKKEGDAGVERMMAELADRHI